MDKLAQINARAAERRSHPSFKLHSQQGWKDWKGAEADLEIASTIAREAHAAVLALRDALSNRLRMDRPTSYADAEKVLADTESYEQYR